LFFLEKNDSEYRFYFSILRVNDVLIWQLLGDFLRILTLAFGYQIVVKAVLKNILF
jgi:PST family polysaccharide transporter